MDGVLLDADAIAKGTGARVFRDKGSFERHLATLGESNLFRANGGKGSKEVRTGSLALAHPPCLDPNPLSPPSLPCSSLERRTAAPSRTSPLPTWSEARAGRALLCTASNNNLPTLAPAARGKPRDSRGHASS